MPERNNHWIDLYESRVGERAETLPSLSQLDGRRALKIVWYGDPVVLKKVRPEIAARYRRKSGCAIDRIGEPGIHAPRHQQGGGPGKGRTRVWRTARAGFGVRRRVKTICRCWPGLVWGSRCGTGILQQSPRPEWSVRPVHRRPLCPGCGSIVRRRIEERLVALILLKEEQSFQCFSLLRLTDNR